MSDWSSDVCSSDLHIRKAAIEYHRNTRPGVPFPLASMRLQHRFGKSQRVVAAQFHAARLAENGAGDLWRSRQAPFAHPVNERALATRSEEHTSELQSLLRNPYAVFCFYQKKS